MVTKNSETKSKTAKASSKKETKETKPKAEAKTKKAAAPKREASDKAVARPKKEGPQLTRVPLLEKTFFAKPGQVNQRWIILDAANQNLGRLSSVVANLLMGKERAEFTQSCDMGDNVIILNASKVAMTGKKWEQKVYNYHTNYAGGIKTLYAKELRENNPEEIIKRAVWGMLPKSKGHMVRRWYKKLHVYTGGEHPHKAQKPQLYKLNSLSVTPA